MKTYTKPTAKVLALYMEQMIAQSGNDRYIIDDGQGTDDDALTRKKNGWCSDLWTKSGDEIDF